MRIAVSILPIAILLAAPAFAEGPEFEVASIKPSGPPPPGNRLIQTIATTPRITGGPGTADPERIVFSQMPLRRLLLTAYEVHPDQISGPNWLDSEKFDINAKVPPGATKEQVPVMLRNLLLKRFKITLHRTSEPDKQAYELIIAKNGPKLKEVERDPTAKGPTLEDRFQVKLDSDGFPAIPDGQIGMRGTRRKDLNRITCRACSMEELLQQLTLDLAVSVGPIGPGGSLVGGHIVDHTGLTRKYDFHLEYSAGPGAGGALNPPTVDQQSGPDLFAALEKQLGLKLQRATAMQDVLVIDHIEKAPSEN